VADPGLTTQAFWWLELPALAALLALVVRAALRFQAHYQERHYSPAVATPDKKRKPVGDRPLSWWAVKRVFRCNGKYNSNLAWELLTTDR
ncbi:MAG TPA: hypothetical protein VLB84_12675, partial [Bacteroidia bacterium]|nr:hypothetical protein [Bacteroidia bacterium]